MRAGISPEKVSLVYEGVDTKRFAPGYFDKQACRNHSDLPRDAFVALMIARPTPSKRHDLMLDAFTRLLASGVDARLVFVGDFGDAAFFHEMQIKAHHMEIHSRVVGFLSSTISGRSNVRPT